MACGASRKAGTRAGKGDSQVLQDELFERLVTGHRDIFLEAWHAHFDV